MGGSVGKHEEASSDPQSTYKKARCGWVRLLTLTLKLGREWVDPGTFYFASLVEIVSVKFSKIIFQKTSWREMEEDA